MRRFIFFTWQTISIAVFAQVYGQQNDLLIIAHRGGVMDGIPENTLPAYRQCIASDFYAIEVDLRATWDNQIVVMHDEKVDRTTNGKGQVGSFTLSALKKLDAGQGNQVPTFDEVLTLIKNTHMKLLVDLKLQEQWYRDTIYNIINEYDVIEQIIIGARSMDDVKFFRQKNKDIVILGFIPGQKEADIYVEHGANIIRFWAEWILDRNDENDLEKLVRTTEIWVTAGNLEPSKIQYMYKMGVNGFIHDNPWALKKVEKRF